MVCDILESLQNEFGDEIVGMLGNFVGEPRQTVLAETRPGLWWGAIMLVAGGVFTALGLAGRHRD